MKSFTSKPDELISTPAQNAMKQTAKTPAERGEEPESPVSTDSPKREVREGDAGVGVTNNTGSSPYADRSRPDIAEA